MVRNRLPVKIVNEPAAPRRPFHPAKQRNNLNIRQMMRQQRTNHNVNIARRSFRKRIADHPLDLLTGRGCLFRGTNRIRIQVHSGQIDPDTASRRPRCNPSQHIAVTASHVHNAQPLRSLGVIRNQVVHPRDRRSIRKRQPVHPRNVMETAAKLLIAARPIHQLNQLRAPRKIQRRRARTLSVPGRNRVRLFRGRSLWRRDGCRRQSNLRSVYRPRLARWATLSDQPCKFLVKHSAAA